MAGLESMRNSRSGDGLQYLADRTVDDFAVARPDDYASTSNLESSCQYINQSLAAQGFPPLLLRSCDADAAAQVCNCVYALLQQRQRDLDFRDAAAEQRQRLASDVRSSEARVQRLQSLLEARERDLAMLAAKEQKAALGWKSALERIKAERDDAQKSTTGLQQRQAQLQHELRKKEGQYARLQERLSVLTSEKKEKAGTGGLEIMALLQKEGRQRGTWDGKKADGDFYKMIVDAYERKKIELTAENAALKDSLRHLQEEMQQLVRGGEEAGDKHGDAPITDTPLKGRLDVFDLPYSMSRDAIEDSLRTKMASLHSRMAAMAVASCATEDDATERELELDAQLADARAIIQEQAAVLQLALAGGTTPSPAPRPSFALTGDAQDGPSPEGEHGTGDGATQRQQEHTTAQQTQTSMRTADGDPQLPQGWG